MVPTLVNVAFGALIAAALLGAAFDRRAVAVVVFAAALPSADAAASLVVEGATNGLLHNVFVPLLLAVAIYWDTAHREESWVRSRYGWRGVRVAWVALASFVVAGIGADLFGEHGAALFFPVYDEFYRVSGRLVLSTQEGVVQTYVEFGNGLLAIESLGGPDEHHVASWINPTPGTEVPADAERTFRIVDEGWQAVVVVAAAATLTVRFWETERVREGAE